MMRWKIWLDLEEKHAKCERTPEHVSPYAHEFLSGQPLDPNTEKRTRINHEGARFKRFT